MLVLGRVFDASSPNGSVITHGMVIPGQARNDGIGPNRGSGPVMVTTGMTEKGRTNMDS